MKTVNCKQKLNVENFDFVSDMNVHSKLKRHGDFFPNSVRALIVGPSGSGKTNLLLALLLHPHGLRFENVYIYSKSFQQPKYRFLENVLKGIKEVEYKVFTNNEEVIPPCETKKNSVFVMDDIAFEKQNNIKQYFSQGRHFLVDTILLAQTYSAIGKQLIRDNANFLCIFQQDPLNLKHIYFDHVSDLPFEKFKELCQYCWKEKHGFLVLDKESDTGRYRCGLDKYFVDI